MSRLGSTCQRRGLTTIHVMTTMLNANSGTIDSRSSRNQEIAQWQGARSFRSRGNPSFCCDRPDFGVRRDFARPNSKKGRGPKSALGILVQALQERRQPFHHGQFQRVPETTGAVSRAAFGTIDDCEKDKTAGGGMCRARLSCRLRLERISEVAKCLRNQIAGRAQAWISVARADFYAGNEGGIRSRREHRHEKVCANPRRRSGASRQRLELGNLFKGTRSRRAMRDHCRRYEVRIRANRRKTLTDR